jgi:hypothetical protein
MLFPSNAGITIRTFFPIRRNIRNTIEQIHATAVANQAIKSEIEMVNTLRNGETLQLVEVNGEVLRHVEDLVEYAENALEEANRSSRKHVHWKEHTEIQIFSDNDETECEEDEEEHFAFHDWLANTEFPNPSTPAASPITITPSRPFRYVNNIKSNDYAKNFESRLQSLRKEVDYIRSQTQSRDQKSAEPPIPHPAVIMSEEEETQEGEKELSSDSDESDTDYAARIEALQGIANWLETIKKTK